MSSAVTNFAFEDHLVRMVEIDGEPWFVAKDVCAVLEHSNCRMAVEPLDEDEKGVSSTYTPGGYQDMLIVSEGGLYTLMLRSRQATTPGTPAHRFRKWVTAELLPTIRRTGKWTPEAAAPFDMADLGFRLQMVRETRLTMGRKAAQPLLQAMLDEIGMSVVPAAPRPPSQHGVDFVQSFLDERTEEAQGSRVGATALYEAFKAWAVETQAPMMTMTAFGRTLSALGVTRHQASVIYYVGLRLRHRSEVSG